MTGRIGQQFGNYRLIRLLGTGGYAEVYLGEHIHLKRQAAYITERRAKSQFLDRSTTASRFSTLFYYTSL